MKLTSSAAPSLSVDGLAFAFAGREVLRQVSLAVPAGTVLGILGRSGSGKSTLLQVLMGLLAEDRGTVRFGGQVLTAAQRRGRGGYVPQKPSLLPWRTVLDNLVLPLEVRGDPKLAARGQALAWLERFGLLEAAGLWPHQLSGGMAQRVAVLRAAIFAPDLLFLDEPFSALDALTRLEFQGWLAGMQRETRPTTLLVTHDVREALALCHQVIVLAESPAQVAFVHGNTPGLGTGAPPDAELERALLDALLREVVL